MGRYLHFKTPKGKPFKVFARDKKEEAGLIKSARQKPFKKGLRI